MEQNNLLRVIQSVDADTDFNFRADFQRDVFQRYKKCKEVKVNGFDTRTALFRSQFKDNLHRRTLFFSSMWMSLLSSLHETETSGGFHDCKQSN